MFMESNLYWLYNDDQADSDLLLSDMNGYVHVITV